MCPLYYLDGYKREYIELKRYKGESRGGFANLLHHPHGTDLELDGTAEI